MGGSGHICLPNGGHLEQSGGKAAGLRIQENHSDLLAMSSQIPRCLPNLLKQTFNQTPHKNLSNLVSCLALRASAFQEQGFPEAVAVQIKAPQ